MSTATLTAPQEIARPAEVHHVLPLPRCLADVERRRGARRGPDASVVRVFYFLQLYAGRNGAGEVSSAEICKRLALSRKTVALAIRRLEGFGLLRVRRLARGVTVIVRFVFREIYRLFRKGWTRVRDGVLSFSLSYPQEAFPPHQYLIPPGGGGGGCCSSGFYQRDEKPKDAPRRGGASITSPGRLLERLRTAAELHGYGNDIRARALLSTVGHLVFRGGRFAEFAELPAAVDVITAHFRGELREAPPARSFVRRIWAWARATVEDALIAARTGRAEVIAERTAGRADPSLDRSEAARYAAGPVAETPGSWSSRPRGTGGSELVIGKAAAPAGGLVATKLEMRAAAERDRAQRRAAIYNLTGERRAESSDEAAAQARAAQERFAAWCAAHPEA